MPGIDLLISRDLSMEIKTNMDKNILKKLEKELFFENGMSIKRAIENFKKVYDTFKKFSSIEREKCEKDCVNKIIKISESKNNYNIEIINQKLAEKIFSFYGDSETRAILLCIMGQSHTVSEIQKKTGIWKAPTERKSDQLLIDGLILESGKILKNNKRVSKYSCIFEEVHTIIGEKRLKLEGIVNAKIFNESSIAKSGLFDI